MGIEESRLKPHDHIKILECVYTVKHNLQNRTGKILYYVGLDSYKIMLDSNEELVLNSCYISKI